MLSKFISLNKKKIFFYYSIKLKPTKKFVRECFFSWIFHLFDKLYIIDFFCGSCVFGFDFFFYKSKRVVNLDIEKHVYLSVLNNMYRLNINYDDKFCVINTDANVWVNKFNLFNFSLLIIDPPYGLSNIYIFFFEINRIFFTRKCLFIFLESNSGFIHFYLFDNLFLVKKRKIGQVVFFLIKKF